MPKSKNADPSELRAIPLSRIQEKLLAALEGSEEAGVADGVDLAISQGAYHGASDIHMEPWSDAISLRYRLDGILQQVALIPRAYQSKFLARIKVLADMVVYRKDVPQDGRIDRDKTSCARPLRVSTVPTIKGEKVVIRILGDSQALYTLDSLGFQPEVVAHMREAIIRSQGTVLLTGPSSSGKTTTIYALLREMMTLLKNTTNIVTVEDPVEYSLDRISQIQVNPHADFTFATALRAILRQDPEVIVVGEIRDVETAKMAIQSGLTGHFVISTIHSGTASGVFTRLLDMGIEPFLVASSITGVLAQRLIRLNCPECISPYKPEPIILQHFGLEGKKDKFFSGKGCDLCKQIGFRGRATIGEWLPVDRDIAEFVLSRPTTASLQAMGIARGMETLAKDGLKKARKGITTLEELLRVLPTEFDGASQ